MGSYDDSYNIIIIIKVIYDNYNNNYYNKSNYNNNNHNHISL